MPGLARNRVTGRPWRVLPLQADHDNLPMWTLDSLIVAGYFVAIFIAGYVVSRRHAHRSANEFLTGGRTQVWWQNGLALLGMAVDPGYMSIAALGFIYGLYVTQWTGVHVWFTTWFAAMFFLPIY